MKRSWKLSQDMPVQVVVRAAKGRLVEQVTQAEEVIPLVRENVRKCPEARAHCACCILSFCETASTAASSWSGSRGP
jgi:hypothetical protein